MKLVNEAKVKGKRVLVRCDFDLPLTRCQTSDVGCQMFKVADSERILRSLPTIRYLIEQKAKVILISHLGRPEGKVVEDLRLDPAASCLSKHLKDTVVAKIDDCLGDNVGVAVSKLQEGDVLLLENLRFYPGEEENDPNFAKELASLGDIYVNEAIAVSHRCHASIVGLPKLLPAYAGFNLAEEVKNLSKVLRNPKKPLVFLIGGAKPETKAPLIEDLSRYADSILVGGTLMHDRSLRYVKNTVFPIDSIDDYDIGPRTIKMFKSTLAEAGTIVWNGPISKFEDPKYEEGTKAIALAMKGFLAFKVVGGGDTVAAVKRFADLSYFDFVSSAGGAMLEFLAKKTLPGIEALGC